MKNDHKVAAFFVLIIHLCSVQKHFQQYGVLSKSMGNLENGKPVEQNEETAGKKDCVHFVLHCAQKNLLSCTRSENNIFILSVYEKH